MIDDGPVASIAELFKGEFDSAQDFESWFRTTVAGNGADAVQMLSDDPHEIIATQEHSPALTEADAAPTPSALPEFSVDQRIARLEAQLAAAEQARVTAELLAATSTSDLRGRVRGPPSSAAAVPDELALGTNPPSLTGGSNIREMHRAARDSATARMLDLVPAVADSPTAASDAQRPLRADREQLRAARGLRILGMSAEPHVFDKAVRSSKLQEFLDTIGCSTVERKVLLTLLVHSFGPVLLRLARARGLPALKSLLAYVAAFTVAKLRALLRSILAKGIDNLQLFIGMLALSLGSRLSNTSSPLPGESGSGSSSPPRTSEASSTPASPAMPSTPPGDATTGTLRSGLGAGVAGLGCADLHGVVLSPIPESGPSAGLSVMMVGGSDMPDSLLHDLAVLNIDSVQSCVGADELLNKDIEVNAACAFIQSMWRAFTRRVRLALYKWVKVIVSDGDTHLTLLQVLRRSQRALLKHKVNVELILFAAPTVRNTLRRTLHDNMYGADKQYDFVGACCQANDWRLSVRYPKLVRKSFEIWKSIESCRQSHHVLTSSWLERAVHWRADRDSKLHRLAFARWRLLARRHLLRSNHAQVSSAVSYECGCPFVLPGHVCCSIDHAGGCCNLCVEIVYGGTSCNCPCGACAGGVEQLNAAACGS